MIKSIFYFIKFVFCKQNIIEHNKENGISESIDNVIESFKHGQFEKLNDSMRSLESSDDSSDESLTGLYEIIIENDDEDQYYCTYCKGNFNKHNHRNSETHKYNLGKRETVYNFNGFFSVDVQQRNDLLDNEGWLSNAVIECYLLCILPTKSHILRNF
jgi:hypothetical protein